MLARVDTAFQHHERRPVRPLVVCPACGTAVLPVTGNWRVYAPTTSHNTLRIMFYGRPEPEYCPNAESCPDQARLRLQRAFLRMSRSLPTALLNAAWPEDVLDTHRADWPDTPEGVRHRADHARQIDDLARLSARQQATLLHLYDSPVEATPSTRKQYAAEDEPSSPSNLGKLLDDVNPYSGLPDDLQAAADAWWKERRGHVQAGARLLLDRLAHYPAVGLKDLPPERR